VQSVVGVPESKPPPIQAQGDFYVMNFEEVESPEGLTLAPLSAPPD
jgi:hypothetical protein